MLAGMAVILELRCAAHGIFENHEKACLWGCPPSFVQQEFRTPPSIRSGGTRFVDEQLKGLAHDYKLRDIKNDKDGSSVMQSIRKGEDFAPKFVEIPHPEPGWSRRGEEAPKVSPAPYLLGNRGENALDNYAKNEAPQRGALGPPQPKFVNKPNPEPGAFR